MSSTMKILYRLIPSLAAVIVLMTGSQDLLAQGQAGPLFTERFSNVFDPASRTYFSLQGTEGKQFGGQQPFASIGATHYLGEIDSAVTLYTGQFMMNYNAITGNPAGSLGMQQRWLTDLPVLERSILGAGLYLDFTQSRYNNLFQQVNVNLELFTESAWVARANAYLPVGQIQQSTGLQSVQGGPPGQLSVVGTTVGLGGINHQWMDVALMGSDLELGRKFFNYRTEVYGGYYNWNGPLAGFANGVKGGVRSYLTNNLSGNVNISHDQFFGTNVYGGLTYFFGGSGGSRPNSFENLMTLPAQRSQQVSIGNYVRDVSTFKPLHDSITGDELHMYFVKENGLGAGTQVNPSNVNSVLADTHFATGSAMVLMDANGNITSPIALNHDRQQIIGGGSTGTADVDFSLALGQAPGTSVVHLSNLGGRPVLAPTTGNAVTLTNQNTIQGFTIDGSGGLTNGISGNPGATDTVIRDMILQNIAGTGIKIQPSTNTTVDNVTFANNGVDLLLNAANSTITNITSTGAINGSLNLGGSGGDITGTTLISNVNITGAGGFGGILLNNAQNGSVTNLTNVNISAGTGSGVTVTNSQTGSIYNLTNVDVLNVGGNGMSLQNSNGTFNVNGTSSVTNAGTAALAINGGAINVQYDGTISQGVAGSAVAVTGNHTGTVNFGSGSSINTTLGDGLQFNGADGSYTFLGTTTMNGGDAGIDIFNSNGNFVFTNPFINNTASGMGVKIVGGGGDVPVTTFNGLNISSISNQGFFVSNGGLTTVNGTATVNTQFGTAFESQGTALAAVFTDITSTQSPAAGININNSSGTFGVTGSTTVSGAALSGINIMNSNTLTSTFQNVAISNVGTGALDNGVTLSTAGTVTILGGTINGSTGDGIHSSNTNLTATGLNIGGTGTITGDGIEVVNTGTARTVNISNNTIKANASGISTKDSGVAKELLLTLDGNTLQSLNGGSLALSVIGNGLNSTIIQSMNGGTVIGGTGGGVAFNRVTFDASGTALSGTQLDAGNWTIGTTGARVQGDGLRFDAPTGDLKYGTLNVANNAGTGLYVDTKTLGTTFALTNSGGSIDSTSGSAMFLDPLTTNLTFGTVSSTNSTTTGATFDAVTGTVNINQLNISGAAGSGLLIQNSSGLTSTIQSLTINTVGTTTADNGVTLSNAGNVNILGGSIQGTTGDGIHSTDTNLTIDGLGIVGGSIAGDALQVVNTTGSHTVNVANSALYGGTSALATSDSGAAGGLILSLDNNTYSSAGVGSVAFNVTGSGLNSTIIKSMNGGTVFSGGSANFNRVTFDASGAALSGTQVNAGNWTFGGTTRLNGDGLNLTSTSGDLQFGNLIINNDGGTGLLVDTKTLGTTFTLGNTGGIIDTANGAALALDPLTTNLTFQSVTSVNSSSNGITLDTVAGVLNLGTVNITNAAGSGLSMDNSTASVTAGPVTVNGAVDGLLFGTNTGGSFTATGTTTLTNVTGSGINLQGATGTYNFADLNITSLGTFTGLDFRNSNVLFTSGNTTITGNGAAGSIGIDLSGSTNPNGANSTTSNIRLATGAGQTAIINNVDTGILMGNVVDGSAGAYLVYGNQTALNSGSQINVTPTGVTLDTTNLTSTNGYTQGRYEFLGVAFTGIASFQKSNDLIFVGSSSSGTDDGSSPLNRISVTELLALDATPSNLDGKTVVLVNDNGGVGIDLGANTLTLGDNTILDSFGNGQTFSTNGVLPVNVIVDTISGNVVYSDPNGAATLTNNGSMNLVTLGNGDTIQNLILSGGTNTIFGSGIAGANINNNTITGSSLAGISLTNTTGAIGITQNTISNTGTDGILLTNAGAVSVNGGTINGTGGDGIHSSDTNLTATNVNIGGTGTITGDGIEIVNNGSAHTVNLSNNTIKANASGISTVDSGNAGELVLTLDGNTLQSLNAGSKALSVLGGGLNSTIVTSMNGGTVIGGANSGGVVFNQVTFDASGTALSGTQVTAGDWTIGTSAARVQGDGLRFDGPSGNLAFGNLNIANNAGTGLYVDTKTLGTTFTLSNSGGSVDTTGGSALFLDPLTTNMTLGTVTSTNSTGTGVTLDAVSGSLTIGTLNLSNSAGDGVYVNNSTGTFHINGGSITGALGDSFHVNGGSANVTYDGTINSSANRVAFITNTTGGSVTFGGLIEGEGPGEGIRLTNNAGDVTFNGDVSLGAATALSNEAVYMTNNSGGITFGNLDVNVNTLTALGAIYGANNSLVTIGGGNVTSVGAAALNIDLSKIDFTLSSITASGGTDGLDLTNLTSGSSLSSTTTTITGVEQTGIKLLNSQGTYNFGTLDINGAKKGIDFRNSNLSFTSANTTLTGDGSGSSVAIDLSGTQNPNGANSTTPNIQLANAAGQTAIINNFGTGVRMGNAGDGSAGAYFIYGNQTPIGSGGSGSEINVVNGGLTLDGTHLTSTNPYTQGRYEFTGVSFTGAPSFSPSGVSYLFVGSISAGSADGSSPTNRLSISQLLALDATPSNLSNKTIVLINDSGTGGGSATLDLGGNTLTLGDNTVVDSFGNGQSYNIGYVVPVNVISDSLGTTYTDPFGNGVATLTNNGAADIIALGNTDSVQNFVISGGNNGITGNGIANVNISQMTIGGTSGASGINLVNTTGTITLDMNTITGAGLNGITLNNAGTVSITGGSIDGVSNDGINSIATNLTVSGVTIGGSAAPANNGITIAGNGSAHTVNINNSTITAAGTGIATSDTGASGELVLSLDGNTVQSTGSGLAIDLVGSGLNSTIVQSMNGGTILGGGSSSGVTFDRVTFDASGASLSGSQVAAGNWTIGTTGARVEGDGLRLNAPTGNLTFATLNVANNNGTGLYVDTTSMGTSFNLGTGAGTIDTTNGAALFLDPPPSGTLTLAMTLDAVNSTNSSTNGITLDRVGGSITINGGTITNAANSDVSISNSSASMLLSGLVLNTNGNTGVTLNHNSGTVTFTDLAMTRTAGDTAFAIDALSGSTGKITINGTSTIGNTPGTAFLIGAGSRDIDATGLSITNDGTTTGPVISITGQSGGTITFGGITNTATTADNVLFTTGQTGGTLNFGVTSITGFGDATTDTAVSLAGTGGTVSFSDLDITTANGGGLSVGGVTFAAGSTPTINATGGTALDLNGTTLSGGAQTFDSITANGGVNGISLNNVTGTTTFTTVNIDGTTGAGILLSSGGTVAVNGGTIDGTADDGVHSSDTDLTVDSVVMGGTVAIVGDGIEIVNNGVAHTVILSNNTITADASGISTVDSGTAGELLLTLDNNTLQSLNVGSRAMSILGGGLNSTIIQSMNGGTIIGGPNSGGVYFSQVTFDASGTALLGTQLVAGDWTIGTNAARIQGDGLRFDGPTGDLAFGNLNIANNAGTGLYVDTKSLGTTFSLGNSGGTIDTTNGSAAFLDPLTTNLTFSTINSTGSGTNGITLDTVAGTFTVDEGTITNASNAGINIFDSSATVNMTGVVVYTNGGTGVKLNGNTGPITFTDMTMIRTSGDTAFNIDATTGSTGKITIDGGSSIGNKPGQAFVIGAGSRDIDAAALAITNDNTTTGPVISITNQSGGTIDFGTVTNSGTTADKVISIGNFASGTVNFGATTITNFGDASTDRAVNIIGAGGMVNFADLDITTTNGGGLAMNASGLNPGSSPTIDATGGTALFLNGGTVVNGTFDSVKATNTGASNRGIVIAAIGDPIIFNAVDINGTGTVGNPADGIYLFSGSNVTLNNVHINGTTGNGITVQDIRTVNISNSVIGDLSAVAGDGISYTASGSLTKTLNITDVTIGSAGSLAVGDQGIVLSSTGTGAVTANIRGGSVYATNEALATSDTGTAKQLVLSLGGTTGTQTFDRASAGNSISVVGSGLNSTIVTQLGTSGHEVIVDGGSGSGGVVFNRVTFDASGSSLSGTQVSGAALAIGSLATRVVGDGLRFDAPTGNLSFGNLTIFNDNGTGLFVDTKTLGTTFSLGTSGGTIDTTNGAATYLDPLTTNMTLDSLSSDNSGGNGVWLDGVAGTFTVTGATTVTNAGLNGILIENSSGTINLGDINIDTTGADGVHINSNTGTINFNGTTTIQNTTGDGIDEASAGGGVTFGTVGITNAGAHGINLGTATGSYNFGATTINGFGINKTGVNFAGASAAATFGVTDIQNAGNGTGIDLSSTTGNKTITFATGSNISNVNLGVELSSSHTTATTANANFTFGDGAVPAGSTIDATTTVNAIGLDAASGTYNFNDVTFTGTASLPGGAGGALFVSATAINGTGDGSYANPYSVSDADAVTTAGATFAFLDGTYDLNTLNGGTPFTLSKNQSVEGFDNGNTVIYGTVQPANISGNLGASGGIASRTGTLSITNTAATDTFTLLGGNNLLDLTLVASGSTTSLVSANGAALGFDNTNGISLNGLTMTNTSGSAIGAAFTGINGNVSIQGNNINFTNGRVLYINGGTADYTIARGIQPDAGNTPGVLIGTAIDIRNTTGGSVSLNGMTLSGTGTLVTLDNNDATFSFANNTFSGGANSTLFNIDTSTGGSTSDLTFDATNSITQARGTIAKIGAGSRNIDLSLFDFNNINTTNANVISSVGQTGGTIKFGTIGISNYNNAAGTAVSLTGSGGTVQFADLDISAASGNGLNVGGITFAAGATPTITTLNGRALILDGTTLAGGSETFDSVTSNGGFIGINLNNVTGTTTFTTVDIDNTSGRGIVLGNAGTVFINGGTVDGTADSGIYSFNTNLNVTGLTLGATSQIGLNGIEVINSSGSHTLAVNSTTVTDALGAGITVDGSGGGTTTVTAFNGNTVSNAGAGGILFNTVTFDSDTATAGIQQVTGGNTTIGDLVTTTNVSGDGLVLNNVLGDIAFGTLNIGNDNGTGLYIRDAAGKVGSFAFSNTGGSINTTNGSAMDIDPVTMNSTFANVKSTNANGQGISTVANGIYLNTITGSVTINTGSITGATGGSFAVDGGNAAIFYGGDITNTAGRLVSVANTTGGSVTFGAAGTITDSGVGGNTGTGILLSNVAGNVSFNGETTLTNSDSTGVDIQGGSGTFTFGHATTITSATGIDFNVNGGTSSVTYNGGMTQALNNVALVNVQGGHNSGTLTFQTGTLDATSGTGLQFNNADGTYNFNGTTTLHGGDAGVDIINGSSGAFAFGTGTTITSPTGTAFNMDSSSAGVTFSGNITQANNAYLVLFNNESAGTVTFQTGTLNATNGSGILMQTVGSTVNFNGTTNLNGGDAGVDIIAGSAGTFSFGTGTSITSPTGAAFNVGSSSANVTYSGNMTQANNASLVSISNESAGTITFQTGTLGATNGNGIQLSNVDSTVNFNGTTTLNGGDAGIDIINGSAGTITFGTGTTVTNPSGLPYNEDTSTANVTFNGSITKTSSSNSAININAKTGGATSFNGLVTASTGATNAISLTSNTGGTINFANTSGTSNITTTSGNGFNFTGGGSLNVTGNNYVVSSTSGTTFNATAGTVTATGTGNTIASTTGRAVNINGATIGGSGVTFKSVSANGGTSSAILLNGTGSGNFTVTGDGTAAAGAQGGNASGGTIQNITGADAISLNNVGGAVSLKSMSILNITSSTDASDAKQTLSGVDAIQGTGTIGGLSLVGVKISNTSDMAINGVTGTSWNGLTIDNSLLEKSNRFGVSGKGDDSNEGMVQILGISGTASITNSKFDQGARLLDLQTGTSGNLNLTATNNTFSNSWKGFDSAADSIYYIGGDAVRILTQGSATATVIIGDQNQSNSALGNFFLNDKYSLMIGHTNSTDTGLIKTTVSENNFQATNHKSPTGSPLYNYPNGTVLLLGKGIGGLNANVSNNTFDQLTDNQGLFGSLNVAAENGTTQVRINANTFIKPWDHSMHLRTNNSATLTAEIYNNTYVTGTAGGAGTDSASFNGPWDNVYVESIGSGASTVNVTVHDEAIPTNVNSLNDLEFKTSFAGQTMNVFLYNLTAPKGYRFNSNVAGATINIYRNGSAAGTVAGILSDNNVTGGSGSTSTDPPTVVQPGAGTVQGTNSAPLLPSFTVP